MSEEKSPEGWKDWEAGKGKNFSGCIDCSGRGKCRACEGTGKIAGDVCTICEGSGKCQKCGGTGKAKKENKPSAQPEDTQSSEKDNSQAPPKAGGPKGPGWFSRKKRDVQEGYADKDDARKGQPKSDRNTSRFSDKNVSRFMGQILILITLIVHVVDGLVFQFSIRPGVMATRITMYLVLMVLAHYTLKHTFAQSAKEFMPWAIISIVVVPLFSMLLRFVGIPEAIITQISAVVVGIPVWLFYFMYIKGLNYKYEGTSVFGWFLFWLTPVGLARIWFFVLVVSALIFAFNSIAISAENLPGAENSGYDVVGGAQVLVDKINEASKTFLEGIQNIETGVNGSITKLYNDTLGQYYTGQVEQNKEVTGVFITEFESKDTLYENQQINIYGLITARSFVDQVKLTTTCKAQNTKNSTDIILGTTDPKEITIYQQDQQGIICTFENGLPAGDYKINLTADFNFETWAYATYTFMDRDFVNSIRQGGENVNDKFSIDQKTRTIYTNGPVMLGLNENLLMPISLTTDVTETNKVPVGMTLDNKQSSSTTKGTIKTVNKFQLRIPKLFYLDKCTKEASTPETDANSQDYYVYTFTNINPSLSQSYMSVSCNLGISPSNAAQLLGLTGGKAVVSIIGTAKYNYELSKQIAIKVNKDPTLA